METVSLVAERKLPDPSKSINPVPTAMSEPVDGSLFPQSANHRYSV